MKSLVSFVLGVAHATMIVIGRNQWCVVKHAAKDSLEGKALVRDSQGGNRYHLWARESPEARACQGVQLGVAHATMIVIGRSQWCVAKHNAIIMLDPDRCKGWTPCKCWTHCKGMTWCRALTRCNQSKNDDTSKATGDSLNYSKKQKTWDIDSHWDCHD